MNSRYKNNIDVWMKSHKEALQLGARRVTVEFLAENEKFVKADNNESKN